MGQTQLFQFPATSHVHVRITGLVQNTLQSGGGAANSGSLIKIGEAASLLACYYHILPPVFTLQGPNRGRRRTKLLHMRETI